MLRVVPQHINVLNKCHIIHIDTAVILSQQLIKKQNFRGDWVFKRNKLSLHEQNLVGHICRYLTLGYLSGVHSKYKCN